MHPMATQCSATYVYTCNCKASGCVGEVPCEGKYGQYAIEPVLDAISASVGESLTNVMCL